MAGHMHLSKHLYHQDTLLGVLPLMCLHPVETVQQEVGCVRQGGVQNRQASACEGMPAGFGWLHLWYYLRGGHLPQEGNLFKVNSAVTMPERRDPTSEKLKARPSSHKGEVARLQLKHQFPILSTDKPSLSLHVADAEVESS